MAQNKTANLAQYFPTQMARSLLDHLSSSDRETGRALFLENKVQDLYFDTSTRIVTAKILDTSTYHVYLSFASRNMYCSCSRPKSCSHRAAGLYAAGEELGMWPPAFFENPPDAPQQKEETQNLPSTLKDWLQDFEKESKVYPFPNASLSDKKLAYVLQVDPLKNHKISLYLRVYLCSFSDGGVKNRGGGVRFSELWNLSDTKAQLEDKDWEVLLELTKAKRTTGGFSLLLEFPQAAKVLQKIIQTNRCFLKDVGEKLLRWGEPRTARFSWEVQPDGESQKLVCSLEKPAFLFLEADQPCYLDENEGTMGLIPFKESVEKTKKLLSMPPAKIEEVSYLHEAIATKMPSLASVTPQEIEVVPVEVPPVPHLELSMRKLAVSGPFGEEEKEFLIGTLYFQYEAYPFTRKFSSKEKPPAHNFVRKEGKTLKIIRDLDKESRAKAKMNELQWELVIPQEPAPPKSPNFIFEPEDNLTGAFEIISQHKPHLEGLGWVVEITESFPIRSTHSEEELYITAEPLDHDWIDVELGTLIDGERINLIPFLAHTVGTIPKEHRSQLIDKLSDEDSFPLVTKEGKAIMLSGSRLRTILKILLVELENNAALSEADTLKLSKWNAALFAEMEKADNANRLRWFSSDTVRPFVEKIKGLQTIPSITPPKGLKCELRSYQTAGVSWLQFLAECDLNGILADDMGLGKTVQALTHILLEKEAKRMQHPCLVVAPTSLMSNWFNEARQFTPKLKVLILQGQNRKAHFDQIEKHDVVLTTYPLLMRDKEILLKHEFHLLILDEAQMVKNAKTQAYQVLQQIRAKHRLCLTGTPMENHLGEIWALFNFLLPGFLGNQKYFQHAFRKPIEAGDGERQKSLTQRLKPFMLRRTKQQVSTDLPPKTEIVQRIDFGDRQRDLYEAIRLKAQEKVMSEIAKKGLERSQITVLDALLKMRQVCCDPRLLKIESAKENVPSAKLDYLMEILPQMIDENRKIILFSQFTSMLQLIEEKLAHEKIAYTKLTGSTKDRKTPVETFQSGKVPLMLLSLKAGGVGLNLTAADTVIHYDPWWNPAAENQATDRAHRIGQNKAVFIYKLVVNSSVEEKILALQERKKGLLSALLESKSTEGMQFTMEDLNQIFEPLPS